MSCWSTINWGGWNEEISKGQWSFRCGCVSTLFEGKVPTKGKSYLAVCCEQECEAYRVVRHATSIVASNFAGGLSLSNVVAWKVESC